MRTKDPYMYCSCFSAWIFGNPCELRILYVLLLFFGLDIWKPMRTKDLIRVLLLYFCGLDIWKPVRTKDLIRVVIVFLLGYLETRAN